MTAKLSDAVARLGRRLPVQPETDADLLGRFLADRDEAAFALIVRRHGPLVFGVCKRVTGDHHLAEDAFQAVFVVLAAKAGCVRPRAALPAFLHGVAYRTATRARTMSDRRRRHESLSGRRQPPEPGIESDLVALLDEEVSRLPDGLRLAVVRCELQGVSRKEAARELGVPEGTVSSRLAAARKALAARLRARGVPLTAAGLTAGLGQVAAGVPGELVARAVAASLGPVPAAVAALSNGVLRMMLVNKLKAVPVLVAVLAGGLALAPEVGRAGSPSLRVAAIPGDDAPRPPVAKAAAYPRPKGPNKILVLKGDHLTLLDPDGKNERRVAGDREEFRTGYARLSPDGTAYAAMIPVRKPGEPVGGRPPSRLHVRELTEPEPGKDLGVECYTFCWSPDGTRLATTTLADATGTEGKYKHHLIDVKTGRKTALGLPPNHTIGAWTADDKLVTNGFDNTPGNPRYGVHLMNLDGTEHRRVADGGPLTTYGLPSPDGKRLLALQYKPPAQPVRPAVVGQPAGPVGAYTLVLIDVATGETTPVEGAPEDGVATIFYRWSPDGQKIAFVRGEVIVEPDRKEFASHLIVADPDGSNPKTVLSVKGERAGLWLADWR